MRIAVRRWRRSWWFGGALALAAAVAAPPASALTVGIGEQQAAAFADPRLRSLGLKTARLNVPWDAATSQPLQVQAWLDAVTAAGLVPQVAFEHLRGEQCPSAPCSAPTPSRYRDAVAAFRARFPSVTTLTTWNEANHQSQPVAQQPELVASYYRALTEVCPRCTVVAGDVLDSGSYVRWLSRFRAAAGETAQLYGLHNYGDVTYGVSTGIDAVLATVPGTLWLEETGGIVTLRNAAGRVTLSTSESRAATAIDHAFTLARARPRVTRLSVYHWKAAATARFDSGLLRPDDTTRPSYDVLARRMASLPATVPATAVGKTPRWTARWQGRRLLLTARCTGCAGRVTVTLRGTRLGIRTFGAGTTLRFLPPRALRRALWIAGPRRVVIRIGATRTVVTIPRPSRAAIR